MEKIYEVLENIHNKIDELIEKYAIEDEDVAELDEIFASLYEDGRPEDEQAIEEE